MNLRTAAGYVRSAVIVPTLHAIGLWSPGAEEIVLGTGAVESGGFREIRQRVDGPALSLWQIEPATHRDVLRNYLAFPSQGQLLSAILRKILWSTPNAPPFGPSTAIQWARVLEPELFLNPRYACAIARLIYRRASEPLPAVGDFEGQAALWKLRYNTPNGKGDPAKYVRLMEEIHA